MTRDHIDALTDMADTMRELAKNAKAREAALAEAQLILAMADDIIRRGQWHPSMQQQVSGVRSQIRRFKP